MNKEAFIKRFSTDREFAEKAMKVSNLEEARSLAKNEGYNFSDDEINQFFAGVEKLKATQGGHMNEESLELVAGGFDSGITGGVIDDCCPCESYDCLAAREA